jgi:histidyl-tRNA synthetase
MMADAEVIGFVSDFLTSLGISDLELRINSIGCPECRHTYRNALREFLKSKYDELCETCKGRYERNPLRILDCKSPVCQELVQGAPVMLEYLCDSCKDAFADLKRNLDAIEIEYIVDPELYEAWIIIRRPLLNLYQIKSALRGRSAEEDATTIS